MTDSLKTRQEAAVPNGAAASSAPEPGSEHPVKDQPSSAADQPVGKLVRAVLLSLFVCPGFGHRHLGRITAAWIVLGLFLTSFIYLGYSMNQLVQTVVAQLQTHRSADLLRVLSRVEAACRNAPEVDWALKLLLIVYLGAPVELAYTWLKTRNSR